MNSQARFAVISVFSVLVCFSGCASKTQTNRQINSLQAQVGVLTDEMVRLDDQLQQSRAQLQMSGGSSGLSAQSSDSYSMSGDSAPIGGVYRTASGFEVPSASIQQALKNAGYYNGPIDGKIGPGSRKAIRAFQKDNGMHVDGIVGKGTWKRLQSYVK